MKKYISLCLVATLLICFCCGCGKTRPIEDASSKAETTETTSTEQKSPLEEMQEAQGNFTYGTYTTSVFENTWLNLRFTPYSNMYSNPEIDKKYNEVRSGAEYEYEQKSMMEFYVENGNSSNGFVVVAAQKLKKISTARECLQSNIDELETAIESYPQLSLNYGEQGTYELCGEEYEYQKYSISGGVEGADGTTMLLCRILDGYAIFVQIKTGYYTIEQQLECFEAIN